MEGLSQVLAYGEFIKCEQEKPKGSNIFDGGPCKLADEINFFITKRTKTEDCRVVKMDRPCIACPCNKGPVEVYWKPRAL